MAVRFGIINHVYCWLYSVPLLIDKISGTIFQVFTFPDLQITFIMCASFMLCWTPYAVVAMMKAYYSHLHLSTSLSAFPALAAKTSHVIDPIIYCGLNKNFSRIIPEVFKKSQEIDREQLTTSLPLKTIAKVTFDQKEWKISSIKEYQRIKMKFYLYNRCPSLTKIVIYFKIYYPKQVKSHVQNITILKNDLSVFEWPIL